MTSSVYFKFKSQKEPSRVEFDGTGVSVFELKRDIIIKSGLGDGTEFDLAIYSEDNTEGRSSSGNATYTQTDLVEYDDDTTIIPRSTTVIARRLPPARPGAGRAARYVSGKMPATARNSSRRENTAKAVKPATTGLAQMSTALTEEDRMMAMFQAQSDQWNAQQEEMSQYVNPNATTTPNNLPSCSQTAVYKPGGKKPANVPDHEPPVGYVCYRCGQKGHWIQVCPTNDNPEFDNRPRVKRTTGIPRSFLKTVDKSALQQSGADGEDAKPPAGVMVNADGDFVIAEPDKASWEQFQAKTKSSAATQKAASAEDKELEEKGLLCSIDKRMFIEPMKTPCCEKTYCNDCITNSLIESDFVCPACGTDRVLIDDLKADDETSAKIQEHLKNKESARTKERSQSPTTAKGAKSPSQGPAEKEATPVTDSSRKSPSTAPEKPKMPSRPTSVKSPNPEEVKKSTTPAPIANGMAKPQETAAAKKRPADELLENPKIPKAPKAMRAQEAPQNPMLQQQAQNMNGMGMMPSMMPFPMNNMNGFGQPNMNNMNNMNMAMMMGMNPMMNPMMAMNGFNQGGFPNMNNGFGNFAGNGGGPGMNGGPGGNMGNGNRSNGIGMNGFNNHNKNHLQHHPHQQNQAFRQNFTTPNNDDDAYFRKPVNPGRHQNKQRRVRPSDYREL